MRISAVSNPAQTNKIPCKLSLMNEIVLLLIFIAFVDSTPFLKWIYIFSNDNNNLPFTRHANSEEADCKDAAHVETELGEVVHHEGAD